MRLVSISCDMGQLQETQAFGDPGHEWSDLGLPGSLNTTWVSIVRPRSHLKTQVSARATAGQALGPKLLERDLA